MTDRPFVLIPGHPHPRVFERLQAGFQIVRIDTADPALVTPDIAKKVRAVAVSGAGTGRITADFMAALPNLEIVANFGVGYDGVDAPYAGRNGIMVTNTPDVLTEEVADVALGLVIATAREFHKAETWLRQGRWASEGNYRLTPGSLRGRKAGIFGMGRIGLAVARRLEACGLPVAYHNRRQVPDVVYDYHPTLKGLAEAVDILISVVPGTASTEKAVNADILKALGSHGIFVNVGRGSTVDEDALIAALSDGTILAAGLDVFADEPNVPQGLLDAPNAMLLPHVASASIMTRNAMADLVADNIFAWFDDGRPLTAVPETADVKAAAR